MAKAKKEKKPDPVIATVSATNGKQTAQAWETGGAVKCVKDESKKA